MGFAHPMYMQGRQSDDLVFVCDLPAQLVLARVLLVGNALTNLP